jgi:hypothetical protein
MFSLTTAGLCYVGPKGGPGDEFRFEDGFTVTSLMRADCPGRKSTSAFKLVCGAVTRYVHACCEDERQAWFLAIETARRGSSPSSTTPTAAAAVSPPVTPAATTVSKPTAASTLSIAPRGSDLVSIDDIDSAWDIDACLGAPLKDGLLVKRGTGFPYTWYQRRFTLSPLGLSYCTPSGAIKGEFKFGWSASGVSVAPISQSQCPRRRSPYAFKLVCGKETNYMHACCEDCRLAWLAAIESALVALRPAVPAEQRPDTGAGDSCVNANATVTGGDSALGEGSTAVPGETAVGGTAVANAASSSDVRGADATAATVTAATNTATATATAAGSGGVALADAVPAAVGPVGVAAGSGAKASSISSGGGPQGPQEELPMEVEQSCRASMSGAPVASSSMSAAESYFSGGLASAMVTDDDTDAWETWNRKHNRVY